MPASVEYLIVGQGLAGTVLAWELIWRGRDVLIADAEEKITSSKIAAGLITPITGQRMALSWRVVEMLDAARDFYGRIDAATGVRVFHERPIVRIFRSADEAALWERKKAEAAFQPFVDETPNAVLGVTPAPNGAVREAPPGGSRFQRNVRGGTPLTPEPLSAPFGGFAMRQGGFLSVAEFLTVSRAHFQERGTWLACHFDAAEAAEFPARCVIFCEGFQARANPYFSWIPWKAAKGEILTLRIPDLAVETRIFSFGLWLLPLGGGLFRCGSTYEWDKLDTMPTPEARAFIEAGLRDRLRVPFEVVDHVAAVRPIINESKALIGLHPSREKLGIFNGLGSKGSLHAPFFARLLASHLVDDAPLEQGCDLRKN